LRKIIKSSDTEEVNTFRLHYFPNIPTAGAGHGAGGVAADPTAAAGCGGSEFKTQPFSPEDTSDQNRREAIEEEAYRAGFARGQEEGRQTAREQAASLATALENTLRELDGVRTRLRRQLEQEVVALALQVARKVIRHELTVSQETILAVVKEALDSLEDPGKIAIRLHPEDLKHVRSASDQLTSVLDNLEHIHWEADPGITCGGCYIQTEYGEIDARIEEQLRAVEDAFRGAMHTPADDQ
jgi:flagellar assembly protein FliH